MQILLLSDIHGHTEHLVKLADAIAEADLVCLCGDLTSFQGPAAALRVIEAVKKPLNQLVAVSGNCDEKRRGEPCGEGSRRSWAGEVCGEYFAAWAGRLSCHPVSHPQRIPGRGTGLGSVTGHGREPCELAPRASFPPTPFQSCADRLASGVHAGSRAVREFIEKHRPIACLTGHIHESHGIEKQNGTLVVNPGALAQGRYARVFITEQGAEAELGTL